MAHMLGTAATPFEYSLPAGATSAPQAPSIKASASLRRAAPGRKSMVVSSMSWPLAGVGEVY